MSESSPASISLSLLTPVEGIASSITIDSDGRKNLGRDPSCELHLAHPSISRRHASISHVAGSWSISDLGSRHGTLLNGVRLEKDADVPLSHGDSVAIPPLVFRVDLGEGEFNEVMGTISDSGEISQLETISRDELGVLQSRRLELLMDGAGEISNAQNMGDLAEAVCTLLLPGTGLGRAAVLRPVGVGEQVEVLSSRMKAGGEPPAFSRTLISAASNGQIVRLNDEPILQEAVSIVGAGIQQAMCIPVEVGGHVELLLYVDSLDSGTGESDAAAFVAAIARLHGLALANLKRVDLEQREKNLLKEMESARAVQERLMPPMKGVIGDLEYVVYSKAGRVVAGDLFGMNVAGDGRIAIYLGDVAGKGVGAGMLMASIQATISAYLEPGSDSAELIGKLNTYVSEHSGAAEFVTMFFVQFDAGTSTAQVVDAGHGYALIVRGNDMIILNECEGGPPVGAVPNMPFDESEITLQSGDRLLIYSDGVAEQREPVSGEEFGVERVLTALEGSSNPEEDVERLRAALEAFAEVNHYDDDVTIACVLIP